MAFAGELLDVAFYDRDPVVVARELLGKVLVRRAGKVVTTGRIVETEAYLAAGDAACHAARGRTKRNGSIFGPPGMAYVYSIHARWCFNVVTEQEGTPSAVLVRALEPLLGTPEMYARRGVTRELDLTRGPARLCQALGIDKGLDGHRLTTGRKLWLVDDGEAVAAEQVLATPRIGISSAQELLLRFLVAGSPFVSGRRKTAEFLEKSSPDDGERRFE